MVWKDEPGFSLPDELEKAPERKANVPHGKAGGPVWHLSEDPDMGSASSIMTLNKPLNPNKSALSFAIQERWHLPCRVLETQHPLRTT